MISLDENRSQIKYYIGTIELTQGAMRLNERLQAEEKKKSFKWYQLLQERNRNKYLEHLELIYNRDASRVKIMSDECYKIFDYLIDNEEYIEHNYFIEIKRLCVKYKQLIY